MNKKYEEINEKFVETEYEFLTEQEMQEKGWSESPRMHNRLDSYICSAVVASPCPRKKSKVPREAVNAARGTRGDFPVVVCSHENVVWKAHPVCQLCNLLHRKSDYCDEWMYWVAVKVKGYNKCRGCIFCAELKP